MRAPEPDRLDPRPGGEFAQFALRRERWSWTLLGLTLGLVEGATAAVIVKQRFEGAAEPWAVNFAVAFVSGAPALSNLMSFVWANLAHGRPRIELMVWLQLAFAIAVGLVGLAPDRAGGLLWVLASILLARCLWAGILTVRSSVWIANYPRDALARMTGSIVVFSSIAVATSAGLAALFLRQGALDARWLYALGALAGIAAAWHYRGMRVRREFALLDSERREAQRTHAFSVRTVGEILRKDRDYRDYMFWMGLYGGGNLMLTSQLIVIFTEQLRIAPAVQIALLSVVPLLMMPLFVPWWARMYDGSHVVIYRSRQGWALVAGTAIIGVGTLAEWQPLLWIGAIGYGAALAGANLGWNLGHNDFATPGRAQQYMGVHVTLTGVRGMLAPPLGILVYQTLESIAPGAGRWSVIFPIALTAVGAAGFSRMRLRFERDGRSKPLE